MGTLPTTLPEVDNLTLQQLFEHPIVQKLAEKQFKDLEAEVKIPYVLKDKVLMSQGVHNNFMYSPKVIQLAFTNTEWSKTTRSLFWDHQDDQASEWVGEIANEHMDNDGNLVGDVIVVDKALAMKLAYGARFGVSPKVIGASDDYRRVYDAHFGNFSIVINPAIKTTFLNSEIKIGGKKKMVDQNTASTEAETSPENSGEESKGEDESKNGKANETKKAEETKKTATKSEVPAEMMETLAEMVAEKLAEKSKLTEESKLKELAEATKKIEEAKKLEEAQGAKKMYEFPSIEGLTQEEFAEIVNEFANPYLEKVKEWLKANPGKTVKDANAALKAKSSEMGETAGNIPTGTPITQSGSASASGDFVSEMQQMVSPTGPKVDYEALPTQEDVNMAEWMRGGLAG